MLKYNFGNACFMSDDLSLLLHNFRSLNHDNLSDQNRQLLDNLQQKLPSIRFFQALYAEISWNLSSLDAQNPLHALLTNFINSRQFQVDLLCEIGQRDSFGNSLHTAIFESLLAETILNHADRSSLITINQKIIEYIGKHKLFLLDNKELDLRESLLQYKLCEERDFAGTSALEVFITLLARDLTHPQFVSESITLHLIFFNYKNIYDPKLDGVQTERAKRAKEEGCLFHSLTRGRERKESQKMTREFGITAPHHLPEWAQNWQRLPMTPHKYRVDKNLQSPIVQTFARIAVPFIAGPSGTAFDIASGLQLFLPELQGTERKDYFTLMAAAEVAQGHHSFNEVLLVLISLELNMGFSAEMRLAPWQYIDYRNSYLIHLSESFKQSKAFALLAENFPHFLNSALVTIPFAELIKKAGELDKMALTMQRFHRANQAYPPLSKDAKWHRSALIKKDRVSHSSFRTLSQHNLRKLKEELRQLTQAEIDFFSAFVSQSCELTHFTNVEGEVTNAGVLLSREQLRKKGIAFADSSMVDSDTLGNGDFVFFRFGLTNSATTASRFGTQAFVIDGLGSALFEHGWVSMVEMLTPTSASVIRRVQSETGEALRTARGTLLPTSEIEFNYPTSQQQHTFNLVETCFYGNDIIPGIAIVLLRELRRIGSEFQTQALSRLDTAGLNATLSGLFRPEAKIPQQIVLANHKWRVMQSKAEAGASSGASHADAWQGSFLSSSYSEITIFSNYNKSSFFSSGEQLLKKEFIINLLLESPPSIHTGFSNSNDLLKINFIKEVPIVNTFLFESFEKQYFKKEINTPLSILYPSKEEVASKFATLSKLFELDPALLELSPAKAYRAMMAAMKQHLLEKYPAQPSQASASGLTM